MAINPTQKTSESDLNQMNAWLKTQPWYQDYFTQRGLNMNNVRLSDGQIRELTQIAAQNGVDLGDRMKFDKAGNMNQMGGFAGMPTWAKVAIAAAPVAATAGFGAAGMGPMAGMFGGGGSGVGSAGLGSGLKAAVAGNAAHASGGGLMFGSGMTGAPSLLTTGVGTGVGAASKGAGQSVIESIMGGRAQKFADVGNLLGRFANDEASNRINNANINSAYNNDMLYAQRDRRENESDAIRKLSQASYIKSGGTPFDASKIELSGGRSLPSFNFPRAPISDEMKTGATSLEAEMLKRLQPGGSFTPAPASDFTKRGVGEQVGRIGSLATTGMGLYDILRGRR